MVTDANRIPPEATMKNPDICRIMIVGPNANRVLKVMEILNEMMKTTTNYDFLVEDDNLQLKFLPCVSKFGSYKDEEQKSVRYLMSIDYLKSADGEESALNKLVDFFDQDADTESTKKKEDDNKSTTFGGIMGALCATASGETLESQDTDQIRSLLETLSAATNRTITVQAVTPSPEYPSLKEELMAFREMPLEERTTKIEAGTMGPGKTARQALELAQKIVTRVWETRKEAERLAQEALAANNANNDTNNEGPSNANSQPTSIIDPDQTRYSCRKCRRILFGDSDLQDPPHEIGQHNFSYRKIHHGGATYNNSHLHQQQQHPCQSYFLREGLHWMAAAAHASEGKSSCFHCNTKLGTFNWSGAQCSCGTWVVPAIQIPKSKVDVVAAASSDNDVQSSALPQGTVMPYQNMVKVATELK